MKNTIICSFFDVYAIYNSCVESIFFETGSIDAIMIIKTWMWIMNLFYAVILNKYYKITRRYIFHRRLEMAWTKKICPSPYARLWLRSTPREAWEWDHGWDGSISRYPEERTHLRWRKGTAIVKYIKIFQWRER